MMPECSLRRVAAGVDRLHKFRLSVADSGIVDDGVEPAEPVDLVGDSFVSSMLERSPTTMPSAPTNLRQST